MTLKKRGKFTGMPAGLGMGLLTGMVISFVTIMVISTLIAGEKLEQQQAIYGSFVALLLGSFGGAWIAARIAEEKQMLVSIISGGIYFLVLMCITALFFEGMYENIWSTALLILGSSAAAGFAGIRKNNRGYRVKKSRLRIP